jgi:hypothetical protein
LKEIGLNVIQRRKDNNVYMSCFFPVFVNYIPYIAEGKPGHLMDGKVKLFMKLQTALLESEDGCTRYGGGDDEYESGLDSNVNFTADSDFKTAEEEKLPMVAVRRCLTLLRDMPTPAEATPEVKHRFSTRTECTLQAVSRGRVTNESMENTGLKQRKRIFVDVDDFDQEGQER